MVYQIRYKFCGGFTLIELLVVLSIFSVFSIISVTGYTTFKNVSDTKLAVNTIVQGVRHAQSNSEKMKGDSLWGVRVASTSITVFKGSTYGSRVTSFDQVVNFPKGVTASGFNDVTFSALEGASSATGTIVVTGANLDQSYISINEKGTVTY